MIFRNRNKEPTDGETYAEYVERSKPAGRSKSYLAINGQRPQTLRSVQAVDEIRSAVGDAHDMQRVRDATYAPTATSRGRRAGCCQRCYVKWRITDNENGETQDCCDAHILSVMQLYDTMTVVDISRAARLTRINLSVSDKEAT